VFFTSHGVVLGENGFGASAQWPARHPTAPRMKKAQDSPSVGLFYIWTNIH
jgi:hypothetical protein